MKSIANAKSSPQECYKYDEEGGYIIGVWLIEDEYSPSNYGWYWDLWDLNGRTPQPIGNGVYWDYKNAVQLADEYVKGNVYVNETFYDLLTEPVDSYLGGK